MERLKKEVKDEKLFNLFKSLSSIPDEKVYLSLQLQ